MTGSTTEGIKTVLHPVSDLTAAKAVYAALLGVPPQSDSSYYVGFEAAGQQIGLVPSGDHAAVQRPGELEVRDLRLDEIAGLIDQPLATACPADLATVAAAQALRLGPEANTAIGLLRACLEHRFGSP